MHDSTRAIGAISIAATGVLVIAGVAFSVMPMKERAALLGVTVCTYRDAGALPDPKCTPGAINHAVTQATIHKTICVKGWTATIRPPVTVTEPEKRVSMRQYQFGFGTSPKGYEYDHLIPLELGGAPNDTRNLWPEPHAIPLATTDKGSFVKDGIENALRARVCSGKISLAVARHEIRTNWTTITIP